MTRIAKKITLTETQEQALRSLSNGRKVPAHLQQRALILLYCSEGKANLEIMSELGVHKKTISKWRIRWAENEEQGMVCRRSIERVLSNALAAAPRVNSPQSKFISL